MSDRYQEVYRILPNLFIEGSPVLIEAGALLKDTVTGKVLALIKIKNLEHKKVNACRIDIRAFGPDGTELEGLPDYLYMDINVDVGQNFGAKTPVYLPDLRSRKMSVSVTQVIYDDETVWNHEPCEWIQVPEQQYITDLFPDDEFKKQYSLEVGPECTFVPIIRNGLFQCTCGTTNLATADSCYHCNRKYEDLVAKMDLDYLADHIEVRKAKERAAAEAEEAKRIADAKEAEERKLIAKEKTRKRLLLGSCFGIITALLVLILLKIIIPGSTYNKAVKTMETGDYITALNEFETIKNYKDASEKMDVCSERIIDSVLSNTVVDIKKLSDIPDEYYRRHNDKAYACGERLIKNQQWDEAEKYFDYCQSYENSKKYLKYIFVQKAINNNDNKTAIINLESISGFLDADELLGDEYLKQIIAAENFSLSEAVELLSKPSSLSSEADNYLTVLKSLSYAEGTFKGSHRYQSDGKYLIDYRDDDLAYDGNLSISIYLNYGVAKADVHSELLPNALKHARDCNVVRMDTAFHKNDYVVEIPHSNSCDYISLQNYRVIYIEPDNTFTYFNRVK